MHKCRLSDIATFSQGKQIPVEEQFVLKAQNLNRFIRIIDYTDQSTEPRYTNENSDRYKVSKTDLVMIRYGSQTAGKVVRGFDGVIANNMFRINFITPENYDMNFMYFYLSSPHIYNFLMKAQVSSTMPAITFDMLSDIWITIPELHRQKLIGEVLNTINIKIELNNKINAELEGIAHDLYNYWFVQFDFPDEFRRPYKSSGGKMIYNEMLKCDIPEGWTVESIADNKLSKILKPGIKQFDGQKIYLPTAAIENDRIIDKSNLITYDNREGRANMEPVDNSVWFAKMKNTKKVLYFGDYSSQRINQTILSTGMLGLKCADNALEYIWNFVNNDSFEAVKDRLSHGATQEGVNNDDLLYFPMLIPSIETLRDYSVLVKDLYKQKYFNEIENECLAELRDFLLPMLMNGQVSVS